jgi:small subunit ribosomal protein S7
MSVGLALNFSKKVKEKNILNFEDQILIYSFLGKLIKKGGRLKALKILSSVLLKIKKFNKNETPIFILLFILQKIKPLVNLRVKKVAGISYQLPCPITNDRSCKLAIIWFFTSVSSRTEKKIEDRIFNELLDIYNNTGVTKQKKTSFEKMAVSNRPFIHFLKR